MIDELNINHKVGLLAIGLGDISKVNE